MIAWLSISLLSETGWKLQTMFAQRRASISRSRAHRDQRLSQRNKRIGLVFCNLYGILWTANTGQIRDGDFVSLMNVITVCLCLSLRSFLLIRVSSGVILSVQLPYQGKRDWLPLCFSVTCNTFANLSQKPLNQHSSPFEYNFLATSLSAWRQKWVHNSLP